MWIKVSYMAHIPNEELHNEDIDLYDDSMIQDYFWEQGGGDAFHDHGLEFEIVSRD